MIFSEVEGHASLTKAVQSIPSNSRFVVCGASEEKTYLDEQYESSEDSIESILAASKRIDVEAWFKARRAELEQAFGVDLIQNEGEWPATPPARQGFTLASDITTGEPLSHVIGATMKVDHSWQIPAHFKYGGWNDCPAPEVHCALWKYWEEKYGAKIIGVSHDVLEAIVERPPTTNDEAMTLAWEQYLYCYDIVDQGLESIANLASTILEHEYWFFWWD